jgi:hypothetical protein
MALENQLGAAMTARDEKRLHPNQLIARLVTRGIVTLFDLTVTEK